MAFELSSLITPDALALAAADVNNEEQISAVEVTNIPQGISLLDLHKSLRISFGKNAPGTGVVLREATMAHPEEPQGCKIVFSRAVEQTLAETTIHRVIQAHGAARGMHLDTRDIGMTFIKG